MGAVNRISQEQGRCPRRLARSLLLARSTLYEKRPERRRRGGSSGKKRLARRHGRSGGSVRVLFPSSLHTASSSGGLLPVDSPFGTPSRTRPCMHRIRIEFSVKKFHPQSLHGNPAAAKECEWILLRVSFSKSLSSLRPGSLTKDNLLDLH